MAGERRIDWGADATDARYRTEDTGDGANFVVAEDLDGSTVLLEWDDSATPSTWQVRGPVEMNSNDITGVSSLSTDDLDIGGSDFASSGDFLCVGPSHSAASETFSTTSTSYTGDSSQYIFRIQWDTWRPTDAQTALLSACRVDGNSGSVRVQNSQDGETAQEETGISAGTDVILGPDNYIPTTTSSRVFFQFEIKSSDGSSITLDMPQTDMGVQI